MEATGVLSVAFGLGLLLHASQAAFFTAINGHIKTLFLHRRRLVLLAFLLCVSIFSVFQFATLLLLDDASCGVSVRFTVFFDQAARVSALALVVWKVNDAARERTEKVIWVTIAGIRLLLGGIIVGFTGMTFMPVCFPQPMHLVVGIVHVTFDGVIWGILLFRIVAIWALFVEQGSNGKSEGYGLFLIVLSFISWTIGSFPYLMGVGESIFVRVIPYILTLALAIGVLSCFPSIVFSVPINKNEYKLRGFGSSVSSHQRRARSASSPAFNPADIESNKLNGFSYTGGLNYNGRNSQVFRGVIGAPIVHPGTAIPWSLDADPSENVTRPKPVKAMPDRRPSIAEAKYPSHSTGKGSISGPIGPIMRNTSFDAGEGSAEAQVPTSNPFGKVKTVDLKVAAEAERQRIDAVYERDQERKRFQEAVSASATPNLANTPKSAADYRTMERGTSVKRKPVIPSLPSGPAAYRVSAVSGQPRHKQGSEPESPSSLRRSVFVGAEGESDWGNRYSTHSTTTEDDDTTRYTGFTAASHAPYTLGAPPRIPQLEGIEDDPKVMFINEIVYKYPALVRSIMGEADVALSTSRFSQPTSTTVRRSPSSATKRLPGLLTPTREVDESATSSSSTPVMDRPRHVKQVSERGIFPPNRDYELTAEMRYKKKHMTAEKIDLPMPAQNVATEKKPPRELVFPIPPVRAPSIRKPAPPPITISVPNILSPEIVQKAPTPDQVAIPEQIPSPKPAIPEKSERRMSFDHNDEKGIVKGDEEAAYKTARAWIDSISIVRETNYTRYSDSTIEPLPAVAYERASTISATSSADISEFTASTELRKSLISLTLSPLVKDDGEFTDIEMDSSSEIDDDEVEEEDEEDGSDELTQSEADEMIMSGGEGYSTEEESYEDYFTESDEQDYRDEVVISDIEDGTTYNKLALAERKLNEKLQAITETLPNATPRHFQIGDRIPTFSESRRKYGSRRKPPPSPIGFLLQQRRISQQKIQARLTMLAGSQDPVPLEDLMNRLPINHKRDTRVSYISDGRNSLIARLEMEIGQQESQWLGMHQTLRNSNGSTEESTAQRLARLSQNLAQRRSFLAKLNSGIDRRLSNAQATSKTTSSFSSLVPPNAWSLAEAQMEYLAQAPSVMHKPGEIPLKPTSILESQHTPVSVISESDLDVYEESEIGSPFDIHGEAQRKSFYKNNNLNFVLEGAGEDEDGEFSYEEDYEDEDEDEDEDEEDYNTGEDIQPLPATVYCPSVRSASIRSPGLLSASVQSPNVQQESPLKTYHNSSTTTDFSPRVNSSASLLWNPRTTREITLDTNQLWTYRPSTPKSPLTLPPGVDLRPKKRILLAPLSIPTTHLWAKARRTQSESETGLWKNPKDFRPKSIITSSFATGRSRRSLKRVTFVEEVVTVEPSGFFGKLKKLWGVQKKHMQTAVNPAASPQPLEIELRHEANKKPIGKILDAITVKYQNKMLPPLPQEAQEGETTHSSLWSKNEKIVPADKKTLLWTPSSLPKTSEIIVFTKDTSELRAKTRQAGLPALNSNALWEAYKQPTPATLWTKSHTCYLWPQGPAPILIAGHLWPSASLLPGLGSEPMYVRSQRPELTPMAIESTELWKPSTVELAGEDAISSRLWSGKCVHHQHHQQSASNRTCDSLWPTAPLLPASYIITARSRAVPNDTLAALESTELWKPSMAVAKGGLWSAPVKRSGLWPEGKLDSVIIVGSLWPSASDLQLDAEVASTVHTRSSPITLSVLNSTSLWSPVVEDVKVGLWAAPEKTGLWPKGKVEKNILIGSLWPSAPAIPRAKASATTRARSTIAPLARLESTELWKPATVEATVKPAYVELGFEEKEKVETTLWVKKQEAPIVIPGYLWPSANSLPVSTLSSCTPSIRSRFALTLPALDSTKLWPGEIVGKASLWSLPTSRTGLWPYGQFKDVSVGSLWPSAPLFAPTTLAAPSIKISSKLPVTDVAKLESTELWSMGFATGASLWSPLTKKTGLWPHGKIEVVPIQTLWPCAPSLPMIIATTPPIRSRSTTVLASLESTELWSAKGAPQQTLWSPPTKKGGLWPYGQMITAPVESLWPSAAPLPITMETAAHSTHSRPLPALSLESRALWSTKAVPKASLWSYPTKETGLWPHGRSETVLVGSLWPSAAELPRTTTNATASVCKRLPAVLPKLNSTELWRPTVATINAKPNIDLTESESITEIEEKSALLWAPKQTTPVITSGYLWPSAPLSLASLPATVPARYRSLPILASLESNQLWSPIIHIAKTKLWSAPLVETGLWPHGKTHTASSLWPAAPSLPAEVSAQSVRTIRLIPALEPIQSRQLWSSPKAGVQQLWVVPEKQTGLWPNGKVEKMVAGKLWPCAPALPATYINEPVYIHSRKLVVLPVLESQALWNSESRVVKEALWSSRPDKSGLWPYGKINSTTAGKELWHVKKSMRIVRRVNMTLRMVVDKERVVSKRCTDRAIAKVSGALWRVPEEAVGQKSGWLLRKEEEVRSLVSDMTELALEDAGDVQLPGLRTKSFPVGNLSVAGLWRFQPRTANSTIEAPRARFNRCDVLRRTVRDTDLRLPSVQGTLWDLPEASCQRTWKPIAPQGLWNVDGTTETLSQINARKSFLWNKNGKDRRTIFAHLPLSSSPRRSVSFGALKSVHGSLWTPAKKLEVAQTHGLWHFPAAADTERIVTAVANAPPRERAFITPRTHLLWQKCDKPLQPVIPALIPAPRPWVNKRAANTPPLFLAQAQGPMWVIDKQSERPRELWRAKPIGTKGLWNHDNTLTLEEISRAETKSKLWSKLGSANSIFEHLEAQSIRSIKRPQSNITIHMEGSVWKSPPALAPARPKLWRKEEKSGLWTVNGITMTLSEMTPVPVATLHLWGKDKINTTPIFSDLSLESSRSRREFTPKMFSAPPEGLWRKQVSEQVVERPSNVLWGVAIENKTVDEDVPKKTLTLWQKDNTAAPMFADLPVESFRSKKDTSSVTLPVFSEGMWKTKVVLPESPQLWKSTPKSTGLWDANAKTKTLAQISLERKAKGSKKPLWSKDRASRTTAKVPQRSPLATVRISEDIVLPKVSGGLWKPEIAVRQRPQLWTVPNPDIKVTKPTQTLLWTQGVGSKTTDAVPERTKVAPSIPDVPLTQVSGTLWKPKSPPKPTGLWKRPIKTVASTTLSPPVPLWAKATASRTTTAVPARLPLNPKKKDARLNLVAVSGSLWEPKSNDPEKGLWKFEAKPVIPPRPRRPSLLWAEHSASRTTTAIPVRTTVPKRLTDEPLPTVTGTLWKYKSAEAPNGLWKRPIKTVASFRKTSISTPLWSKELASRTTTARPERLPFVPKPVSRKIELAAATGELWKLENTAAQPTTLWTSKPTSLPSGVWDAEGRTPSLAEIKRKLESRQDTLWQRRSVLTAKVAPIDPIGKHTFIPVQKKQKATSTSTVPPADGTLWQHNGESAEDSIMWITRSSRSSSIDDFVSPNLSRASTLSDMSEAEFSPTTGRDDFSPGIARIHSTKASISSAAGESLWRPSSEESAAKKEGLWNGDEAAGKRRSVLVTARPVRIALPGQKDKELPMFDASHSLWKSSSAATEKNTLWLGPNSDCSASEEDFADAESQFSEESQYEDFEYVVPHDHSLSSSPSSQAHVFVGQFRRDNYLLHNTPSQPQLSENSPFASNIRIRSLRRKLRPTIKPPSEKAKSVETSPTSTVEGEGEGMTPVAPGVGWLWNKGIL